MRLANISANSRFSASTIISAKSRCRTCWLCVSATLCSSHCGAAEWVRDVQITVAEKLGVEGRGAFYDKIGALRDTLQNHLLQLLCIVAMEPPSSIDPDAVRDEN